jgi:hypothetical protein
MYKHGRFRSPSGPSAPSAFRARASVYQAHGSCVHVRSPGIAAVIHGVGRGPQPCSTHLISSRRMCMTPYNASLCHDTQITSPCLCGPSLFASHHTSPPKFKSLAQISHHVFSLPNHEVLTAITTHATATYGLSLSPTRAAFQNGDTKYVSLLRSIIPGKT